MRYRIAALLLATLALQGCVSGVLVGTVGSVMVANDRRTAASQLEDQSIELKAAQLIGDEGDLGNHTHISVISVNRTVLMVGQAPNEMLRDKAVKLISSIPNIKQIHNQIRIGTPSSLMTRSNDTWLTSKVKLRMVSDNSFDTSHVKVVTENSEVFLLGLVKKDEAEKAVELARNTEGVAKVIKVFEYL